MSEAKTRKYYFLLILLLTLILSTNLLAGGDKDYISLSAASFDVLQNNVSSLEGRIEYRANSIDLIVKPLFGIMANTDGARYIFSGLFIEFQVTDFFSLIPSFAPGVYIKNYSKDLHFVLEFRSQIEAIFSITDKFRAGFSFNHISNASLGDENPGVESIGFTIQIPVGS